MKSNEFVGVDIGGTKMRLVACHNGALHEKRLATGYHCNPETLREGIDAFIQSLPFAPQGVGMAIPGLLKDGGHILMSNVMPGLNGVDAAFFSRGRYPVHFINDVDAATLAEAEHHRKAKVLAVILVGTAVGMGLAIDGKLFTGSAGWACELGFNIMGLHGEPKRLDELVGGNALLKLAGCDGSAFAAKLNAGDAEAQELVAKAGRVFGYAISNVLHLFNPDLLVVGGGTAGYCGFVDKAIETARQVALPSHYKHCTFAAPRDPLRIAALGARAHAKQNTA